MRNANYFKCQENSLKLGFVKEETRRKEEKKKEMGGGTCANFKGCLNTLCCNCVVDIGTLKADRCIQ